MTFLRAFTRTPSANMACSRASAMIPVSGLSVSGLVAVGRSGFTVLAQRGQRGASLGSATAILRHSFRQGSQADTSTPSTAHIQAMEAFSLHPLNRTSHTHAFAVLMSAGPICYRHHR